MDRSRQGVALAVALLVVTVAGVGGVIAAAPAASGTDPPGPVSERTVDGAEWISTGASVERMTANETPTRLGLGEGRRVTETWTPTVRLGPAVAVGDSELRVRFFRYRARQALAEASGPDERLAAVREILNETADAVEQLRDRETAAVRAYHAGEIDRGELLRRLAVVHLAAEEYGRTLTEVRNRASNTLSRTAAADRILRLSQALAAFESPVRDRVASGIAGGATATVQVTATEAGVAIEAVFDGRYVRDAVRVDRAGRDDGELIGLPSVQQRLDELYPYAYRASLRSGIVTAAGGLFRVDLEHPQGTIRTYINRDTEAVYREVQTLRLDRTLTETVVNRTIDGLRIVVERVGSGDPTRVVVVDADTGVPVESTLVVDNRTVGPIDGERWLVLGNTPAEVTVETAGRTVSITIGAETTGALFTGSGRP